MLRCSNKHQFSQCVWESCGDNFWEWELKTKTFLQETKKYWRLQCPRCESAATQDSVRTVHTGVHNLYEFRVNKLHSWIPLCSKPEGKKSDATDKRTVRFRVKLSCKNDDRVKVECKSGSESESEEFVYATRLAGSRVHHKFKLNDSVMFDLCPRDPRTRKQKKKKSDDFDWLKSRFCWPKTPLKGVVKHVFEDGQTCEVECKRDIPWTYQDSPRFTFRHGDCRRNAVRPYKRGPCVCGCVKILANMNRSTCKAATGSRAANGKYTGFEKHDLEIYAKLNSGPTMTIST